MGKYFSGIQSQTVDAKKRSILPASFRDIFENGDPDKEDGRSHFSLSYGFTTEKFLVAIPVTIFDEQIEIEENTKDEIRREKTFSKEEEDEKRARILRQDEKIRRMSAQTQLVTFDHNGRFTFPQKYLDFAGINNKLTYVANGSKLEIWDPDALERTGFNSEETRPEDIYPF